MPYAPLDLTNKTAVVIGGTSGIGLALAKGLAKAGANVIPTGRRAELAQSAAAEIKSAGGKSLAVPCDVTNRASIEALLAATIAEFGSVEILVNCAGTTKRTPTLDVSEAEWNNIIEINLNGTFRACQVFGRHMIERKYGRIINIASISSFVALFEVSAYCASKARRRDAHKISRGRVGKARRLRQRHRARRLSHRSQRRLAGWNRPRQRIHNSQPDGPLRPTRRTNRRRRLPRVRLRQLHQRPLLAVDGGMLASGVNQ